MFQPPIQSPFGEDGSLQTLNCPTATMIRVEASPDWYINKSSEDIMAATEAIISSHYSDLSQFIFAMRQMRQMGNQTGQRTARSWNDLRADFSYNFGVEALQIVVLPTNTPTAPMPGTVGSTFDVKVQFNGFPIPGMGVVGGSAYPDDWKPNGPWYGFDPLFSPVTPGDTSQVDPSTGYLKSVSPGVAPDIDMTSLSTGLATEVIGVPSGAGVPWLPIPLIDASGTNPVTGQVTTGYTTDPSPPGVLDTCKGVGGAAILTTPLSGKQYWEVEIVTLPAGHVPDPYSLTSVSGASDNGITENGVNPEFYTYVNDRLYNIAFPSELDAWGTPSIGVVPGYYLPKDLLPGDYKAKPRLYQDFTRVPGMDPLIDPKGPKVKLARSIVMTRMAVKQGDAPKPPKAWVPGIYELGITVVKFTIAGNMYSNENGASDWGAYKTTLQAYDPAQSSTYPPAPTFHVGDAAWRMLCSDNPAITPLPGNTAPTKPAVLTPGTWFAGGGGNIVFYVEDQAWYPLDVSQGGTGLELTEKVSLVGPSDLTSLATITPASTGGDHYGSWSLPASQQFKFWPDEDGYIVSALEVGDNDWSKPYFPMFSQLVVPSLFRTQPNHVPPIKAWGWGTPDAVAGMFKASEFHNAAYDYSGPTPSLTAGAAPLMELNFANETPKPMPWQNSTFKSTNMDGENLLTGVSVYFAGSGPTQPSGLGSYTSVFASGDGSDFAINAIVTGVADGNQPGVTDWVTTCSAWTAPYAGYNGGFYQTNMEAGQLPTMYAITGFTGWSYTDPANWHPPAGGGGTPVGNSANWFKVRYTPGFYAYASTTTAFDCLVGDFVYPQQYAETCDTPSPGAVLNLFSSSSPPPKPYLDLYAAGYHSPVTVGRWDQIQTGGYVNAFPLGDGSAVPLDGSIAKLSAYANLNMVMGPVGCFTGVDLGDLQNGDRIMFATDTDTGYLWIGKNGKWYGPGDQTTSSAPIQTGALDGPTYGTKWAAVMDGMKKSATPITASASDTNPDDQPPQYFPAIGYRIGAFEAKFHCGVDMKYAPPSGFKIYGMVQTV